MHQHQPAMDACTEAVRSPSEDRLLHKRARNVVAAYQALSAVQLTVKEREELHLLGYEPSVIKGFAKSRLKKLESKNTERISAEARLNDAKTSLIQIVMTLLQECRYQVALEHFGEEGVVPGLHSS